MEFARRPLADLGSALTDDDYLEIKVIDDPDELQRLCERPAALWKRSGTRTWRRCAVLRIGHLCSRILPTRGCTSRSSGIVRSVATLSEVVRSTQRIVAGAAAFQLEAGRKAGDVDAHGVDRSAARRTDLYCV